VFSIPIKWDSQKRLAMFGKLKKEKLPLKIELFTIRIAVFGRCPSACGGCFHPPVETGGIEIGRIKHPKDSHPYNKKCVTAVTTATHLEFVMTPNLRPQGANHRLHPAVILW